MKKALVTFMVALFATVVLGQSTKADIQPVDLPGCIHKYINDNFAAYSIEKCVKLETNKVITYEVTVTQRETTANTKERVTWILTFNNNCKLIKKMKPVVMPNNPNANNPASKPKVQPRIIPCLRIKPPETRHLRRIIRKRNSPVVSQKCNEEAILKGWLLFLPNGRTGLVAERYREITPARF